MTRRPPGSFIRQRLATLTEVELSQPLLDITEKELFARAAVKDSSRGVYLADFSEAYRKRPEIACAMATGYAQAVNGIKEDSAKNVEDSIKLFVVDFLDGIEAAFRIVIRSVDQVTREHIDLYLGWLRNEVRLPLSAAKRGDILSEATIAPKYRDVKRVFDELRTSEIYSSKLNSELSFQKNATSGAHRHVKHRPPLSEADLRLLRDACQIDISDAIKKLEYGLKVKLEPSGGIEFHSASGAPFNTLDASIKAYLYAEECGFIAAGTLAREMPGFDRATRGHYFGKKSLREYLHFTSQSIVPFVVLTQMVHLFAVDSHLTLKWKQITESILRMERMRVDAVKGRGNALQVKTFRKNDLYEFSPSTLLKRLKQYSEYTRRFVKDIYKDNIFIFVDSFGIARGFLGQEKDHLFIRNLHAFTKKHGLKPFTLSQLKPTASVLIGPDIASRKIALHHEVLQTTEKSYDPSEVQVLTREKIGYDLSVRERMITTSGRIDTRGKALSPLENTAVTLGFSCIDPQNSPIAGQIPGKLCTAYCLCPACPLAVVDIGSPKVAFRLIQLVQKLKEFQAGCSEARWLKYYKVQLEALEETWLQAFSSETISSALRLKLSPIPEIE